MNILFLTTGCLATNPRLVKNYIYQKSCGNKCKILGFQFGNWSDKMNEELINKHEIDCILIPPTNKIFFTTLVALIISKLCKILFRVLPSLVIVAYASDKKAWILNYWLKKIDFKADVLEAHNLSALFPAFSFSRKKNISFGFDVEDYHPGELIKNGQTAETKRRKILFKEILPFASFITSASPLIGKKVDELMNTSTVNIRTINNSFYSREFPEPTFLNSHEKLRFIWFSQTITFDRGLELFIEGVRDNKDKLELHLIGNMNPDFEQKFISPNQDFIFHRPPISQASLHHILNEFDVGLATEISSADINKEICLSNKLFAYVQAGLFVLATDTKGQKDFFGSKRKIGVLVNQTTEDFEKSITMLLAEKSVIRKNMMERYIEAKKYSFDKELTPENNYLNS